MLELELPGTTFYGKSGAPLEITARVSLSISVDGKTVKAPVYPTP